MKALIAAAWQDKTQTLLAWAEQAPAGAEPTYEDLALVGNLGDAMARYCEAQYPPPQSDGPRWVFGQDASPHGALRAPEGARRAATVNAKARPRLPKGVTQAMFTINDSRVRLREAHKIDTQAFVDRLPPSASPSAKAWLNDAIAPSSNAKIEELRWIRLLLARGEIGEAYVYAASLPAPRASSAALGAAPPKALWPLPPVARAHGPRRRSGG